MLFLRERTQGKTLRKNWKMKLVCSECRRTIGPMLDREGKARLFKCPHSGRVAEAVETYAGNSLSAK